MLEKLGIFLSKLAKRYMPDAYLFALLLTFITMILGWSLTEASILDMLQYWYDGFWQLLEFGMQMCLILVTGYALATSRPVKAAIGKLAELPSNTGNAAMLISFVAVVSGYLNWGFALIVGALLAREVGKRAEHKGIALHYPLLGAAGYMGLAIWHGGFSASAPLKVATEGHFLQDSLGIVPVEETILSSFNVMVAACLIVGIPVVFKLLAPRDRGQIVTIGDILPEEKEVLQDRAGGDRPAETFAESLENSWFISLLISVCGLSYVVYHFVEKDGSLDLNMVNFTFLFLGILLHRTPINYVRAVQDGVRGCAGIILQFPFYAGIMGMMKSSGLTVIIASSFMSVASTLTYPLLTFASAFIVNIFVPSGGGQWGLQGEIVAQTAREMQLPIGKAIMAFCYGDQWSNLCQPFWALALLGITGLRVGHIMGYCVAVMLLGLVFFGTILLLF